MQNLQQYDDYRDFIKDHIRSLKISNSALTMEKVASSFKMSLSSLKMILAGKRNLTLEGISNISRAMRFSESQKYFFQNLVLKDQSKKGADKNYYQNILKLQKSEKIEHKATAAKGLLDPSKIEVLVYLLDQVQKGSINNKSDISYEKIATVFGLQKSVLQKYIEEFLSLKLLAFDSSKRVIFAFDKISSVLSQVNYLKKSMDFAQSKIQDHYADPETFFANYIFSGHKDELKNMIVDLKLVFEKYSGREDFSSATNQIVQANIQLFPTLKF